MPAEFWDTQQFRDASADQHIGLSRAYRKHPAHAATYGTGGIPQEVLAAWLGLTQAQISRIENGPPVRHLDQLAHWARTIRIPEHLLWFALPGRPKAPQHSLAESPPAAPPSWPHAEAFASTSPRTGGSRSGLPDPQDDMSAMRAFRAADMQVGGGHLYATVVSYLHREVAPRIFRGGGDHGDDQHVVFNGAAALTEMAGWMAHDAGRDTHADQHFARALDLVGIGGDRQLAAHVLGSKSHLAHHCNRPKQAVQLAGRGREVLQGGPVHPELEARLLAMQARGFAALRQAEECLSLLAEAERALGTNRDERPSPWVSHFDEASLASEAARCMRQLGDRAEARRQAERIITLRAGARTRSHAFGQLLLVAVLVAENRPDEACAVAKEVLDSTQWLGSFLVIQQLLQLKELLNPYQADAAVKDFIGCLEEAVHERRWLWQSAEYAGTM